MRTITVLSVALCAQLTLGCAAQPTEVSDESLEPPLCSKQANWCDLFQVSSAEESALRSNGGVLAIRCPMHFLSPPAAAILPECQELIPHVIALLNRKLDHAIIPIDESRVAFETEEGCVDTFIPGREAMDCYTQIVARVPVKWLPVR
jgi:hypothetical protein